MKYFQEQTCSIQYSSENIVHFMENTKQYEQHVKLNICVRNATLWDLKTQQQTIISEISYPPVFCWRGSSFQDCCEANKISAKHKTISNTLALLCSEKTTLCTNIIYWPFVVCMWAQLQAQSSEIPGQQHRRIKCQRSAAWPHFHKTAHYWRSGPHLQTEMHLIYRHANKKVNKNKTMKVCYRYKTSFYHLLQWTPSPRPAQTATYPSLCSPCQNGSGVNNLTQTQKTNINCIKSNAVRPTKEWVSLYLHGQ